MIKGPMLVRIRECPQCGGHERIQLYIKRYFYREVFVEGMSLTPGSINVLHRGVGCHVKWEPVKKLRKV